MNGLKDEALNTSEMDYSEEDNSDPKMEVAKAAEEASGWSGSEGENGEDPLASPTHESTEKNDASTPKHEENDANHHSDFELDQSGKNSPTDERSGQTSPINERSGQTSPVNERSGQTSPINEISGQTSPVNDASSKNSPAHSRRSPSPNREASVKDSSDHDGSKSPSSDRDVSMRNSPRRSGSKSPERDVSMKNSPSPEREVNKKNSADHDGSSPRRVTTSPANGCSTSASPQRGAAESTDNGRSQAASPVNINSDTDSETNEKNTSMIDLESDDDCILVEEGRKKGSPKVAPATIIPDSPPPPISSPAPIVPDSPAAAPSTPSAQTDPLSEEGPLRRSRRNTKRKSYQIEDQDSSESDSETKRKKLTPPRPVTIAPPPQIKLVNTSLLMANNVKPMNQTQNGLVNKQVFTTMAQRGVSISSTPRAPAILTRPKQQKAKVVPPPPPFHKDSIFAGMTNGQSIVEAPSFLSPLIFVKKPIASLRAFVDELGVEVRKHEEAELEAKRLKELEELEAKRVREEAEMEAKRIKDLEDEAIRKEEELRKAEQVIVAENAMEVGGEAAAPADEEVKEKSEEKEAEDKATKPKKRGRRRKDEENDESWSEKESDESSSESDEGEIDDDGQKTTVLVQEEPLDPLSALAPLAPLATLAPLAPLAPQTAPLQPSDAPEDKSRSYFASPLGGFFLELGLSLVQERVHTDLFRLQQKRMRREPQAQQDMEGVMQFLSSNIQRLKAANCHLNLSRIRCQFCSFRTESALVMAHHMEVPHASNAPGTYRCNFCPVELVGPQAALAHVSGAHGVSARLVKPPALHQCPECPFESGTRGRFTKHVERCLAMPAMQVLKPQEWQPPAKLIKASARPNYIFNSRPRFSPRAQAPMRPLAPPFPQIMQGPRAPRPRAPMGQMLPMAPMAPVVTCGICGSKWSDAATLRGHVLRVHAKALTTPPAPMATT